MSRIQANLLLLLAAAIWGGGFVSQATAMREIGPMLFVSIRFGVAALVVLPFALYEARHATAPLAPRSRIGFAFVGLALLLGATTQQWGLVTTTVTNSGFLTGLYVIFVPLLSVIVFRRSPHPVVWPAAIVAASGIYLLSGGDLSQLTAGDGLTVLCALFWGVQILLVDYFLTGVDRPFTLSATQFAICSAGGLLLSLSIGETGFTRITAVLPEILYSGILSSGFAFTLQVVAQRHTTAPQAAIFLSAEALFAALAGALFLNETISGIGYLGCAMMFVAMLAVELVPEWTKAKSRTS